MDKEINTLTELNLGIKYYVNRMKYYEEKELTFHGYKLALLEEKAAHEVEICAASLRRLALRKEKLLMLLN